MKISVSVRFFAGQPKDIMAIATNIITCNLEEIGSGQWDVLPNGTTTLIGVAGKEQEEENFFFGALLWGRLLFSDNFDAMTLLGKFNRKLVFALKTKKNSPEPFL